MIDSHTHLHVCRPDDADLVAQADAAGVKRMLTVGTNGLTCREALLAAERFPQVYAAVGRHPNSATGFDEADLAELRALASLVEGLRVIARELTPFLPDAMGKLAAAVEGDTVAKLDPLFPKHDA